MINHFADDAEADKIKEIIKLYGKVKSIIIQVEQETGSAIISSINEQRNSYDHFLRAINEASTFNFEIDKSKGHLYRAAYDAYEILAISKLDFIKSLIKQYDADLFNKVYPKFFTERYTMIAEIEKCLRKAREDKTDFINNTSNFDVYEKSVNELITISDEMVNHIPLLSAQKSRENSKWIKTFALGGVAVGIIILFIEYFVLPLLQKK